MDFGLFVNTERPHVSFGEAWDEDLFELVLADELGIAEAWVSEHGVTPELLICKAAAVTERIKMGPGVRPLPFHHPLQVAIEANATDHLTNGRYQLGIGLGGPESGAHAMAMRGIPESDRRDMMHEAIEYLIMALSEPDPFDFDGRFWTGKNIQVLPDSVQRPRVPIGISTSGTGSTIRLAAENGFLPIFSHYSSPEQIRAAGDILAAESARHGRTRPRSSVRGCGYVYVAETTEQAKRDVRDAVSASIEHHKAAFPHHYAHLIPRGGSPDDIAFDYLVDIGYLFIGDPKTVHDSLKSYYDRSGGIGTFLLLAGKDFGTRDQRRQSWTLFMNEVAPRFALLDPDAAEEPALTGHAVRELPA
jgi:alkanesulfonate monooxygenase SsuD/methylene tetrahydromethanopterin reductase-like flavin-dependent oxidoreductase (luciferase family)